MYYAHTIKLKNLKYRYMSLREWKELPQSKTKVGKMKNQLYDQITAEKIKSKTSDAAITKSFRLDEIIEGLKGKPQKKGPRIRQIIREDRGIGYAPEVDPYEDMDVEGLLNLEDYVPPQGEKQIAPKPPKYPKYEMDPSSWHIDPGMSPPPAYDDLSIAMGPDEPLAIEAPRQVRSDEEEEEEEEEDEESEDEEEDPQEANKILDHLNQRLPNYDDVELRLGETEMTATKQRNYLDKVVKDAVKRRRQVTALKTHATIKFKKGEINAAERDRIHGISDKYREEINGYIKHYKFKSKTIKGYGVTSRQKGRGVYFYHNAKELLNKLTLIIGEMEVGNTSIEMRNMGVSILDTLLKSKAMNEGQYQKLVKKYFKV